MSFRVHPAVSYGSAEFGNGGEWCNSGVNVRRADVVACEFGGPVHRSCEGFGGDGFNEGDSALGLVVEDGGSDAGLVETALDDIAEAVDGGSDAGYVVEAGLVPFVVVVAEMISGGVAGGFKQEGRLTDGADDAVEEAVDRRAVGVGCLAGVKVGCAAAQVHHQAADGAADAVGIAPAAEDAFVEFVAQCRPVGRREGDVALVGDEVALGFDGAYVCGVEGGVAVSDGHTPEQGEGALSRERMYEFVHEHKKPYRL